MNPTVILIAAFGSSDEQGLKNLEDFDRFLRDTFPSNEVYWAFTSDIIVNKLRLQGRDVLFASKIKILKMREAFPFLADLGKTDVLVTAFLLMMGSEYRKILETPSGTLNVKYTHPLLYYPENIQKTIQAIEEEKEIANSEDIATLFVAHGNDKNPAFNAGFDTINHYLRTNYKNTLLTAMEGTPLWEDARNEVLSLGVRHIHFVAFMLTYGNHMSTDIMGVEKKSMKSQLNLPATATKGLASMKGIQKIFTSRIKAVLTQFSSFCI